MEALRSQYSEGINELGQNFSAVELLPQLKKKYPSMLDPYILSIRIYQIQVCSFLEFTTDASYRIDDEANAALPVFEREYYGIDVSRWTLMFDTDDNGDPIFNPNHSIFLNAIRLLNDLDDQSTLYICPQIFSEAGTNKLVKKIQQINDKFVYPPESVPVINFTPGNFGKRVYSHLDLKHHTENTSFNDDVLLTMPFFDWGNFANYWGKFTNKCLFEISENQNLTHNDPLNTLKSFPGLVEIKIYALDLKKIWRIAIPLNNIQRVALSSTQKDGRNKLPKKYKCSVTLKNGDTFEVNGSYQEKTDDNGKTDFYYKHKIYLKKQ
jgi:hypothetical protein